MSLFRAILKKSLYLKNRFLKDTLPRGDFHCGLVGCGSFVRGAYIPALNKPDNPTACLGLYSKSIKSAKVAQSLLRYKTTVFPTFEALAQSNIRSVLIATPNHLHYPYITESLDKGLDVFCEKPLVNTTADALELKDILKSSNNILMVGFCERYLDRLKRIKFLLGNGEIGKVTRVYAFHNQNISKQILKSEWLSDAKKSGGGVIHHAGIHLINILIYFFGRIDRVHAEFSNLKLPASCGEDTARCKLNFKAGITATLEASYVNAVNSTFEHLIIKGSKGSITSDSLKNDIKIIRNGNDHMLDLECLPESTSDSIYNELVHFYDCVANRKNPQTDIDDFLETIKTTEAMRLSATEKREICIDEIFKRTA